MKLKNIKNTSESTKTIILLGGVSVQIPPGSTVKGTSHVSENVDLSGLEYTADLGEVNEGTGRKLLHG